MKILLIYISIFFCFKGHAQDSTNTKSYCSRNTIYAELLGSAGKYSINYDRMFIHKK
jgi:hypothetical protein